VPQAGAVVSHHIDRTGHVVMLGDIAVEALVQGLETQEVCSRTCPGVGAFALPGDCRDVVVHIVDGVLPDVSSMGQDIVLGNSACQFEVTVGNCTKGVVG
jgi:hypothetical protein